MSSPRKKYQAQLGSPLGRDEPPVMSPPEITAAELPEPVADAKPPEPIETQSPADAAASSAIKARLAEMERAEKFVQGAAQHHQRPASEPQQQPPLTVEQMLENSGLPDRAKNWLRQHPDYVTNPAKLNRLGAVEELAREQVGSQWTDEHFDRI